MTINKSLFSSLPQFPTLRLGSCLHEPITHIPWFVFSRTIYFFSTLWFVSSRTNYPHPLVRVFTNQLPTSLGSCLHEPITHSPGSYLHEPINIKLFKTLTKLTLNVTSKTYFKTRKRKIG